MKPSDLPTPVGLGSGLPLPLAYREADHFGSDAQSGVAAPSSCPLGDGAPSGTGHRLPVGRTFPRKSRDLPGYWAVLREHAEVDHPVGCGVASPYRRYRCCLHGDRAARHPRNGKFRGCFPPAYSLACLRIGLDVATHAARLTTDPPVTLWSDGTFTRWTTKLNFGCYRMSNLLPGQHCLVAPTSLPVFGGGSLNPGYGSGIACNAWDGRARL